MVQLVTEMITAIMFDVEITLFELNELSSVLSFSWSAIHSTTIDNISQQTLLQTVCASEN